MFAEVRTLLDEDVEGFYLNPEIYTALTNGQREYASIIYAQFDGLRKQDRNVPIPLTLLPLFVESPNIPILSTDKVIPITSPITGLWKVIYVTYGSASTPLLERDLSSVRPFRQANSIMNPVNTFYAVTSTQIELENKVSASTVNYQVAYLTEPTDINATINPILPDWTHAAIVQYAYSEMLKKPKLLNEALSAFNQFIQMIQYK